MKFANIKRDTIRPLPRNELGRDIIEFFKQYPDVVGCAIVDDDQHPVGYIDRTDFMTKVSALYGRALYDNRTADSLSSQNYRLLAQDAHVSSLIGKDGLTQEINRQTGLLIVDEQGRYIGITNAMNLTQALLDDNNSLIQELQQEVHDRKAAEERARRLAESDALTGIHNRRHFMNLVAERVKQEKPSYLFYIDLDRFKVINDVRGHAIGDFVLKTIAVRLIEFGEGFKPARLGGDEFAVIADVEAVSEPLDDIVSDMVARLTEPIMTPAGVLEVGASVGVAVYPDDQTDASKLIDAADRAMLAAKADGCGSCIFSECTSLTQGNMGQINERLQQAVHRQKIIPAYQPIISLETGEIVGHEVLARWPSESGENVPPNVFIPAAESMGLIDPLFWVLVDQVFALVADTGDTRFLALNISPPQLHSAALPDRLRQASEYYKIPLELIELEITETAMVTDTRTSKNTLEALTAMGVRIALDDFGTGYSSLSLLREFPISKIKIDQTFVAHTGSADASAKIVDAAIGLCEGLDLVSCGESVETEEVLNELRVRGCQEAQGYLIGRPAAEPCGRMPRLFSRAERKIAAAG